MESHSYPKWVERADPLHPFSCPRISLSLAELRVLYDGIRCRMEREVLFCFLKNIHNSLMPIFLSPHQGGLSGVIFRGNIGSVLQQTSHRV